MKKVQEEVEFGIGSIKIGNENHEKWRVKNCSEFYSSKTNGPKASMEENKRFDKP